MEGPVHMVALTWHRLVRSRGADAFAANGAVQAEFQTGYKLDGVVYPETLDIRARELGGRS